MNVLLIGSGGREHALAWKLAASPLLTKLYAAPGNPGIAEMRRTASRSTSTDHAAVAAFCREKAIDLVVVGPEAPLVAGLADDLAAAGITRVRPVAGGGAARGLEGLHQGSLRRGRHPDRRLRPLRPMRRPRGPMSASAARRSSSRPTGSPPARASPSR